MTDTHRECILQMINEWIDSFPADIDTIMGTESVGLNRVPC